MASSDNKVFHDIPESNSYSLSSDEKMFERTHTLLHIVPFCEGPNKKPEGFAKQKQPAIFAM
jgi:hypothetical protein